jgi:hypothetical protein
MTRKWMLALLVAVHSACSSEGLPPNLRFACVQDVDCGDGYSCQLGHCESGVRTTGVLKTFSSGGAFSDGVQTSSTHTNFGILGQSTPSMADGEVMQLSATHRNFGGFFALERED